VTVLFFLGGIPNNLNDVLIRHFMKSFAITRFQAGWCNRRFTWDIFCWPCPQHVSCAALDTNRDSSSGLHFSERALFVLARGAGWQLWIFSSGALRNRQRLSFLETASNPFIAQLGDPDSSERRLNFAQAFNPLGAITGALIGTVFIFPGSS